MVSLQDIPAKTKAVISTITDSTTTGVRSVLMYAVAAVVILLMVGAGIGLIFWPLSLWFYFGHPLSIAVAIQIVWVVSAL